MAVGCYVENVAIFFIMVGFLFAVDLLYSALGEMVLCMLFDKYHL